MIEETKTQIFSEMVNIIDSFDDAELLMNRFNKELFERMHGRIVDQDLKNVATDDIRILRKQLQRKHARLRNDKFRSSKINIKAPYKMVRGD